MLHHCSWGFEKSVNYVGCDDVIQKALNIILSSNSNTSEVQHPFSGIQLCVIGPSGKMLQTFKTLMFLDIELYSTLSMSLRWFCVPNRINIFDTEHRCTVHIDAML